MFVCRSAIIVVVLHDVIRLNFEGPHKFVLSGGHFGCFPRECVLSVVGGPVGSSFHFCAEINHVRNAQCSQ